MELLVYKASAGSGKTFTLAVEYIKLLIINPRAYRNILAVTFTNKATGEMKERILQQLYGIWKRDPASDAYKKRIRDDLEDYAKNNYHNDNNSQIPYSDTNICKAAGIALLYILHDVP